LLSVVPPNAWHPRKTAWQRYLEGYRRHLPRPTPAQRCLVLGRVAVFRNYFAYDALAREFKVG
jgi:hypothetical protein